MNTVGGTGAAAIVSQRLGVRYFGRSAWDAYLRFTGEEKPWEGSKPMRSGLRLENAILDWYEQEQRPGWTWTRQHKITGGVYHGTLDGLGVRGQQAIVVDAKRAVMRVEEWGTAEAPLVPLGYQIQLAHYGLLAEEQGHSVLACDLAIYDPWADANGWEAWRVRSLDWVDLRPAAITWRAMVDKEVARWQAGEYPAWDGSDAASYWLSVHCAPPRGKGRQERHAADDEADTVARWLDATTRAKTAEEERKALAQDLISRLDGHKVWVGDGYIQAQPAGGGRRVDSKRLKADHPDIFEQYSNESPAGVALRGYRLTPEE